MFPLQILVVDDHAESADSMARLLRHEGHLVTVAGTKLEALLAASRLPALDVLLCDISLPDGTGCGVLRSLHDRRDGAPRLAVALTGYGEEEWADECRRAGFNHLVVKPVLFDQVLELIAGIQAMPRDAGALAAPPPER